MAAGPDVITTPTDTLGHTWQGAVAQQDFVSGTFELSLRSFYVPNCSGGADTITFDIADTENGDITVNIAEFSGAVTSSPLDVTNSASGTSTTPASGDVTPSENSELLYGAMTHGGSDRTITEEAGWTLLLENEGGSANMPIGTEYKMQTTATTEDADWTLGSPGQPWACHVITFKAVPTAGPTRFRLTADTTAPDVSPALQTYSHDAPTTVRRKLLTSDASALATVAYTPDGADHLVAGDALHGQFVSAPMNAGITFTNGDAIAFAIQCLEAHTNNNLNLQFFASVVSQDGGTVRRTLRTKVEEATELATALTNRHLATTQDGASYTTVAGDRLVVEYSVEGTPAGAGGVQGHNASLRWGGAGAGGDLGANDTDTGTTLNPWVEFTPAITFLTQSAPPFWRLRNRYHDRRVLV